MKPAMQIAADASRITDEGAGVASTVSPLVPKVKYTFGPMMELGVMFGALKVKVTLFSNQGLNWPFLLAMFPLVGYSPVLGSGGPRIMWSGWPPVRAVTPW